MPPVGEASAEEEAAPDPHGAMQGARAAWFGIQTPKQICRRGERRAINVAAASGRARVDRSAIRLRWDRDRLSLMDMQGQ